MNKHYIKVVLLGDGNFLANIGRVGKTSLLNKYITDKFNDKEDMTINSCYLEKELDINGGKYTSCIWVRTLSLKPYRTLRDKRSSTL